MLDDERFMSLALRLARRGLGNVYPNPAVGCVIVRDKVIVGRGWTVVGGRPHAEVVALEQARGAADGGTAYVTLEPCCHERVTGPCTTALIQAGIKKAVIGVLDPDPRVSGKGIEILKKAGIHVKYGVMIHECEELNAGFFNSKTLARPLITVKLATTLDGKISFGLQGKERWITNDLTRRWIHRQRAMYDAIMVGSNTVLHDDPMLDCRLPGLSRHSPVRIVIDRTGKLKQHHKVVQTANLIPTYIIVENTSKCDLQGVKYVKVSGGEQFLHDAMCALASEIGITRLFVEGGSILVTELLKKRLVDRLIWTRAGKLSGTIGADSILDIGNNSPGGYKLIKTDSMSFHDDTADVFRVMYG